MTAFSKVGCARWALCVTLLACACGRDSDALFDDSALTGQSGGGSGPAAAGSQGNPVAGDGGEESAGGGETAGSSSEAGKGGGSAGTEAGGSSPGGAATAGSGGKPGAGDGGSGGSGGSSAGMAGTGGSKNPDPVTVTISTFDDSYVASCMPYSNYGSAATLSVDYDNGCLYQSLLAPSLEQLPEGAMVSEAILTLDCVNAGGALSISYVDDPWTEGEVRYTGRPDVGTSIGALNCKDKGPVTLDLTAVLQVWLAGQHPAYGIYIRTEAQDGTDFASSEAADAATRPSLSVTYTPPQK